MGEEDIRAAMQICARRDGVARPAPSGPRAAQRGESRVQVGEHADVFVRRGDGVRNIIDRYHAVASLPLWRPAVPEGIAGLAPAVPGP